MPTATAAKKTVGHKVRVIDIKSRIFIDEARHEVLIDGSVVHVAPKEFKILALLKTAAKTVSRIEILEAVWGKKRIDPRTVDQHIARLRRKISGAGIHGSSVIKTQNSFGYVYNAV